MKIPHLLLFSLAWIIGAQATATAQGLPAPLIAALEAEDVDQMIALTEGAAKGSPQERIRSSALQSRGASRFFDAKIAESIADFDAYLAINPQEDPYHWQRGISYYYAGDYEKGKAQFERHQTVNDQDVENAVFHFICAARAPGGSVEKARAGFITIESDPRVPMKEIWAVYAGKGTDEDVIRAAEAGNPGEEELRNRLCYAHLYLGLFHEAAGDAAKSAEHIALSAGKYRMDHYMGKVAQVHAKLRGIKTETAPEK
jgi:lipoprotein NlpI